MFVWICKDLKQKQVIKVKINWFCYNFWSLYRAPDKLRICVFYAIKWVKTHVLSDQSVHIMHTYCCVSKLSKFGAYLYAVNDNTVVYINNTFLSEKFPVITSLYTFRRSVYIRGVPNVCLSKHRCQKRSDWMFTINHPIAVKITNKCGASYKEWCT
jgi:hypothetical protein